MSKVITLLLLFFSITIGLSQEVIKQSSQLQKDPILVSFQNKIRSQQATIDSLVLLFMTNQEGSIISDIDDAEELEEDIVKLGKLALSIDQTLFEVLNGKKELDAIRKYFLPRFSANFVTVDKNGKGSIAIVSHENIGEHLNNYRIENEHYKIVNIDFLDTEIAGNVFNMAYKTIVEVYKQNELSETQAILTTLTGRREEHLWKVGNYSSTAISFEPDAK